MNPEILTNPTAARQGAAHLAAALGADLRPLPAIPRGSNGIPPGRKACKRITLPGGRIIDCHTWSEAYGVLESLRADQVKAEQAAAARTPPPVQPRRLDAPKPRPSWMPPPVPAPAVGSWQCQDCGASGAGRPATAPGGRGVCCPRCGSNQTMYSQYGGRP